MNNIPKDPKHCTYCVRDSKPCSDHKGPDGSYQDYSGPNLYHPNEYVLEVTGKYYSAWDGKIYKCIGFDPRCGYWMDAIDGSRLTNISNRAIGRTYHYHYEMNRVSDG